jgi:tetratricopeptide (TPR) repeat protein
MKFALSVGDLEVAKNIVRMMKPNPLCFLMGKIAIGSKIQVGGNLLIKENYYDGIRLNSDALMLIKNNPFLNHFYSDDIHATRAIIHQNLGLAYMRINQIGDAIREYSNALKQKPDLIAVKSIISALETQMTKIDESILKLESDLKNNPNSLNILNSLAFYYSMKGEYDKAISYLMKELDISHENPRIYYNLACIYSKKNRLKESRDFMNKAIEKGFSDWDLLKKDHDLDNLRYSSYFGNLIENHSFK